MTRRCSAARCIAGAQCERQSWHASLWNQRLSERSARSDKRALKPACSCPFSLWDALSWSLALAQAVHISAALATAKMRKLNGADPSNAADLLRPPLMR